MSYKTDNGVLCDALTHQEDVHLLLSSGSQPIWPGKRQRAFTLIEIMVVMVLIGLLAGAVSLSVRSYLIAGKQNIARMEIANISQAIETYYATHDQYPSNSEGLQILVEGDRQFVEGLLTELPLDPWKNPYEYHQPGETRAYAVICYGADGREGGTGQNMDISSENLKDNQ